MVFTDVPAKVTDVNLSQLKKAISPMLVTEAGISYAAAVFPKGYCISVVLFLSNITPLASLE